MIVDKELETTTDEFIINAYYLYTLENETDDINVAVDSVYNELTKYNIKATKEQVKKIIELYEKGLIKGYTDVKQMLEDIDNE